MPRTLPPDPNLDQLKNQAKDLLKACRAGDPQALLRIERWLPNCSVQARLADAQLVVAREYGFTSWPRLKLYITALPARRASVEVAESTREAALTDTPRQARIAQLAAKIVELARNKAIEQVLACMVIPSRDLMALRAELVQSGGYTLLVDALLQGLEHLSPRVRFDAAQAMDHFADARCAAPLRRCLSDPVPRVRWAALHSLSCEACKLAPIAAGQELVELVIERALADESIRVRRVAAYTLGGSCYDQRAVAALRTLLARETDTALLRNARWALGHQERLAAQASG
jgi:HEAT repeat protein